MGTSWFAKFSLAPHYRNRSGFEQNTKAFWFRWNALILPVFTVFIIALLVFIINNYHKFPTSLNTQSSAALSAVQNLPAVGLPPVTQEDILSGTVYDGMLGDESHPLQGVTVQLGCSNNENEIGPIIDSEVTNLNGWYGLTVTGTCEFYNIVENDLPDYISRGASSVSGTVKNVNWIQYLDPLAGQTLTGNKFWVTHSPENYVTIHFEEYSAETRIKDQYTNLGVHFYNDYLSGQPYRASAQIKTHANAYSGANVLVNTYSNYEFSSSWDVPLAFWFDGPIASLSFWLGTTTDHCYGDVNATIKLYDLAGNVKASLSTTASNDFDTYVQLDDPDESTRLVVIDFGSTTCPEAIDELGFLTGSLTSYDTSEPDVDITSHTDNQIVNEPITNIEGTIYDYSGILTSVKINGQAAQFYMISGEVGNFNFRQHVTLTEGANEFVVSVKDSIPYTSSDSVTIYLGVPTSVELGSFHLTQRGLMEDEECDVEDSLVAGKPAIVRVYMPAHTASGEDTYLSSVQLMVYEWGTFMEPVLSLWNDDYSSYTGQFNSPSQYAGYTFVIPGETFGALSYKFVLQAYVGIEPIGSPITADCAGEYLLFHETDPVRLFIQPVELSSTNSNQSSDYIKNMYIQLETIERTYPIRSGYEPPWYTPAAGLYYQEAAPLQLCDGSQTMKDNFPNWCTGTGWTWKLIDKDPSAVLRRADTTVVTTTSSQCYASDHILGAKYTSTVPTDTSHTISFNSSVGLFLSGAHPDWQGAKYAAPIDYDHDNSLDKDDTDHLVSSYLDPDTNTWISDISDYENGDTLRFFVDENGNNCNDWNIENPEPQADVIALWTNANTLAFGPANEAMSSWNNQYGSLYGKFSIASEWFPSVLSPVRSDFGTWGPGSSQSKTNTTWIRVKNDQTMAHELGHTIGGLLDKYNTSTLACNLTDKRLTPWGAFIDYKSISVSDLWDVMDCSDDPDKHFFSDSYYDTLFDKLNSSSSSAMVDILEGEEFMLSGWLYPSAGYAIAESNLTSGVPLKPPDFESPYRLVFGQGSTILMEYPFNPISTVYPPQGYATWDPGFSYFNVITAFPPGTEWVEFRKFEQVLWQKNHSVNAPNVTLISPAGGELFGANDEIVIHWLAADPDGDDLRFSIMYSPDNGATWTVLAAGVGGNNYTWKAANSPGTLPSAGKIKVIASDGFNQGDSQNLVPFSLEGKPPQVAIMAPEPGTVYQSCEKIYVNLVARDPERQLDHTIFTVDGQAIGLPLQGWLSPLPAGDHILTLEAFDQQGLSASDSVTITVKSDLDCDGMTDEYEAAYGMQEDNPYDAAFDPDQDGLINFDEAWYGTYPNDPDSDGDGFSDGFEVRMRSNPMDPLSKPIQLLYLPLILR